jgi:hypothetical protein
LWSFGRVTQIDVTSLPTHNNFPMWSKIYRPVKID